MRSIVQTFLRGKKLTGGIPGKKMHRDNRSGQVIQMKTMFMECHCWYSTLIPCRVLPVLQLQMTVKTVCTLTLWSCDILLCNGQLSILSCTKCHEWSYLYFFINIVGDVMIQKFTSLTSVEGRGERFLTVKPIKERLDVFLYTTLRTPYPDFCKSLSFGYFGSKM